MEISAIYLLALVVLLVGISKSAFAGALGVFAVPILMIQYSAIEAITLMLPILIIADLMSVKSFWKKWDLSLLLSLLPGAFFGVVIASAVMNYVNSSQLRYIIAAICVLFAFKNICFKQMHLSCVNNPVGACVMSSISGMTSTLIHAGGPPIIMYFSAIGLTPTKFVATATAFFAIVNLVKLVSAVSLGFLTLDTVLIAVCFTPIAFLGNWLGVKLHNRTDQKLFLNLMNYILLMLSLWLFYSAYFEGIP